MAEVYDADVSHETVPNVTEVVADGVRTWQNRPVDEKRFLTVVANP